MNIEHIPRGDFRRINNILEKVGQYYIPSLEKQVPSIQEYSKKLAEHANTFLILDNEKDIGILSVYCNDFKNKTAFISTFGIDRRYNGLGYAKELLDFVINYLISINFFILKLEVNKLNKRAIQFYKKNRFSIIETRADSYLMQLKLRKRKKYVE